MRYFKTTNEDGILVRLDRAESNVASGTEIHKVEFDCATLGVQIFLGGADKDKVIQKYREENGLE